MTDYNLRMKIEGNKVTVADSISRKSVELMIIGDSVVYQREETDPIKRDIRRALGFPEEKYHELRGY